MSAVVARESLAEALPPIKGFMFDLDGTLLLSDRSLGGYEVLPGAVDVLTKRRVIAISLVLPRVDAVERSPALHHARKLTVLGWSLRTLQSPVLGKLRLAPESRSVEDFAVISQEIAVRGFA